MKFHFEVNYYHKNQQVAKMGENQRWWNVELEIGHLYLILLPRLRDHFEKQGGQIVMNHGS